MFRSGRSLLFAVVVIALVVSAAGAADARKQGPTEVTPPTSQEPPVVAPPVVQPGTPHDGSDAVAPPATPDVSNGTAVAPPLPEPETPAIEALQLAAPRPAEAPRALLLSEDPVPVWGEAPGGAHPPAPESGPLEPPPTLDASVGKPPLLIAAPAAMPEARAERADARFAYAGANAALPTTLATTTLTPMNGPRGWDPLPWTLSLLGMGAVGAVLVLRRRATDAPPAAVLAPTEAPASKGEAVAHVAPDDIAGLLRHGHAAIARGDVTGAMLWFRRALEAAPGLAIAHFCLGVCLSASGRVAEAYGAFEAAVELEPEDAGHRIHLARAALTLGKNHEAMRALAPITESLPDLGNALLEDPELAGLRDHPQFLMMCGAL